MKLKCNLSDVLTYLLIALGTVFMAVGVKNIYDVAHLVTGGFTGISIILKGMTQTYSGIVIPLWFTNFLLNIPLFVIALYMKGIQYLKKSIAGTAFLSIWLYLLPEIPLIRNDILLTVIFGGLISGFGIGIVLRAGGTTGGVDLLATLIHYKMPHYSVTQIMQVLDAVIILIGAYSFGINMALYAILAVFITVKVSDNVIEGWKYSKTAYIITEKYEQISNAIMERLERGVTALDAVGMYSREEKDVLFCVVSKKEIVKLKDLIYELDQNAFVIITDAREVLGEGFIRVP
ncbi:MAG: YitT family protein [Clostridia bacterium]|nr:YitT family protein [Clostridia bacterium]